jgi:FAM192A/Fyv6, N-terminal domain
MQMMHGLYFFLNLITKLLYICREEQYYAIDDVLGRDTASVFPNESKKAALQTDAAQAILQQGNKKFISETELAEIKSITGGKGRVEDGSIAADKPLAQILREQREAKDAQFKEQWKQMKTGKNRPLDEDELDFLDGIAAAENAKRKREAEEEAAELDAFHQALKEQQETQAKADAEAAEAAAEAAAKDLKETRQFGVGGGSGTSKGVARTAMTAAAILRKPKITAIVRPKRSLPVASKDGDVTIGKTEEDEQAKKHKVVDSNYRDDKEQEEEQEGLAGLVGDYGSDSD